MQQLPLQVADVDDVEIDDAERADAGGRQVHRGGRSETARADAQHLRGFQRALPVHADFGKDQVTAVAPDLVARQRRQSAARLALSRRLPHAVGAPPATDGMMLTVSPVLSGV